MQRLLLADRVIDGTGAPPLEGAAVRIDGERIVAVEREYDRAASADGDLEVVDLGGSTLLPGLIDSHVHLTAGHSPWEYRRYLREKDDVTLLLLRAVEAARGALVAGITTLRDCGGRNDVLIPLRDAIDAGLVLGPRLLVAGAPITTTAGHMWYFGIQADGVHEVRKAVRAQAQAGVDFIKVAGTGGGMTPGSNPRAPQYGVEELRAILEEGDRLGKPVTAHMLAVEGIRNGLDAGLRMIEHASFFSPQGTDFYARDMFAYEPALVDRMADQEMWVSQALSGWERALHHRPHTLAPELREYLPAQWQRRAGYLRDMRERGVRFIAGSDGFSGLEHEYRAVMEMMVQDVGLTPVEAIHHGTGLAAEALGIADRVGTIAPGLRADLLAVRGDPSREITDLARPALVLTSGRVVAVDGRVPVSVGRGAM
jgi:imidazolonepropionase-like amidohydrolase